MSPRGRRERAIQFGISDESDNRLTQVLAEEKLTNTSNYDTM